MVALGALTFAVLLRIPFVRIRAVRRGQVTVDDFKLGESDRVPVPVSLPNRNYMNLLELPTLFYAVCLALFVLNKVASADLILAWGYVGLRASHSLVHITYNNVLHRLLLFASSNVVLSVLWLRLALVLG
jgi:hypothetical protein